MQQGLTLRTKLCCETPWRQKFRWSETRGIGEFGIEKCFEFEIENTHSSTKKLLSIRSQRGFPPKVSVSDLMGTLKGKLAIKLFKSYPGLKEKPYWGNHFWSRGYFVSTVGIDEEMIRRYVKYQEEEDKKEESQTRNFDLFSPPSDSK